MLPLEKKQIAKLRETDIAKLAELDAQGLLLGNGEPLEAYKNRLCLMNDTIEKIRHELDEKNEYNLFDVFLVKKENRISKQILKEASRLTNSVYGFSIEWVPGFYLSESIGLLWGGCAIYSPEDYLSFFLVRKAFATQKKWFIYTRQELLSHEICHVGRMPLNDMFFEEHFAYQLSTSWLRRTFGNCFQSQLDAVFFLTGLFLLLIMQAVRILGSLESLPIWPFWILAGLYPAYQLYRNYKARKYISKAKKRLDKFGLSKILPVLFRCTKQEIIQIAGIKTKEQFDHWLNQKVQHELRWKVIKQRFID